MTDQLQNRRYDYEHSRYSPKSIQLNNTKSQKKVTFDDEQAIKMRSYNPGLIEEKQNRLVNTGATKSTQAQTLYKPSHTFNQSSEQDMR